MTTANAPFDLSDLRESYQQAEVPENNFGEEVPQGTYQAKVDKVELAYSQSNKRMLKQQLRIISGPHANRVVFRQNMLETPENHKWLKADLSKYGVALKDDDICDLPNKLGELLDITMEIKVVVKRDLTTNEENRNVYLNKRIVVDPALAGAAHDVSGADPSLCPF